MSLPWNKTVDDLEDLHRQEMPGRCTHFGELGQKFLKRQQVGSSPPYLNILLQLTVKLFSLFILYVFKEMKTFFDRNEQERV
jgi:hypothetical protein